jgi:glycosyltransferase involved in cell wall biosynthesis
MRILNVTSNIDPVTGGGEAERSYQMSRFLACSGAECTVLTTDTGLDVTRKGFLGEGRVIAVPCLNNRFSIPRISLSKVDLLVAEADMIHLMGHWTLLNALVYLSARKQNKPYVVCPAGALTIFGRSKWLKRTYNMVIGKSIVRNATCCIAVTPDETASFVAYGVSPDRVCVIPNGISEVDFHMQDDMGFRKKFGLGKRPYILFVGRLNLIKGPDLLLDAFCGIKDLFPEMDLVFVGPDGGMLRQLQDVTRSRNVQDRVYFLGYLGGVDKSHAYHASRLLAIPSRQEAMSIVVLEAGVSGTPVLLTDQCGFNQLSDVGAGWVVPATVEGLRGGLMSILSDSEDIAKVAKLIHEFTVGEYLWSAIVQRYWSLYRKLLDK